MLNFLIYSIVFVIVLFVMIVASKALIRGIEAKKLNKKK